MLIIYIDLNNEVIPLEENVFGVNIKKEKIAWQIEKRKYPDGGYSINLDCITGVLLI